jgi:hypothetical protein
MSSLERFENKKNSSSLKNALAYYNVGVAFNSKVVGLGPGANPTTLSYNASVVRIYSATM